jgi:hypothetical protein
MVIDCLKSGFYKAWRQKRMIFLFYVFNLFFAYLLFAPVFFRLKAFIGDSMMSEVLAGKMDMGFFFEFLHYKGDGLFAHVLIPIVVYLFISLFLSGGALTVFASHNNRTLQHAFWGGGARYFARFVRLFFWSLIILIAFLFVPWGLFTLIQKAVWGGDPSQVVTVWGFLIKLFVTIILLLVYAMIVDYARIRTVLNDEKKMRIMVYQSLAFVFTNFAKTFSLSILLFLIGLLWLILYNLISGFLAAPDALVITLLVSAQQIYMLVRMYLKLGRYAAEMDLYDSLSFIS